MMKLLLFLMPFAFFQINSCSQSNDKWVDMGGPNRKTSLVAFFKKGTSHDQISKFKETVLSKPSPYGPNTGRDLPDGVAEDFLVRNCSYEGVGINFSTAATGEQRGLLRKRMRESEIVLKVYEDVIPSEIKDLCLATSSPEPGEKKPVKINSPQE
jgi:hypothetical protein